MQFYLHEPKLILQIMVQNCLLVMWNQIIAYINWCIFWGDESEEGLDPDDIPGVPKDDCCEDVEDFSHDINFDGEPEMKVEVTDDVPALEAFQLFFPNSMVKKLKEETNRLAWFSRQIILLDSIVSSDPLSFDSQSNKFVVLLFVFCITEYF